MCFFLLLLKPVVSLGRFTNIWKTFSFSNIWALIPPGHSVFHWIYEGLFFITLYIYHSKNVKIHSSEYFVSFNQFNKETNCVRMTKKLPKWIWRPVSFIRNHEVLFQNFQWTQQTHCTQVSGCCYGRSCSPPSEGPCRLSAPCARQPQRGHGRLWWSRWQFGWRLPPSDVRSLLPPQNQRHKQGWSKETRQMFLVPLSYDRYPGVKRLSAGDVPAWLPWCRGAGMHCHPWIRGETPGRAGNIKSAAVRVQHRQITKVYVLHRSRAGGRVCVSHAERRLVAVPHLSIRKLVVHHVLLHPFPSDEAVALEPPLPVVGAAPAAKFRGRRSIPGLVSGRWILCGVRLLVPVFVVIELLFPLQVHQMLQFLSLGRRRRWSCGDSRVTRVTSVSVWWLVTCRGWKDRNRSVLIKIIVLLGDVFFTFLKLDVDATGWS